MVLTHFDNISFTSAPGIRKRFQSSPNALETCYLTTPKPGRGFPLKRRRTAPDIQFTTGHCSGMLTAAI
jgi:hypothetical protein